MEAHESENPLNFESVRATWIAKQLKLREASFTKAYDITCVFVSISHIRCYHMPYGLELS
jgi:hypothetical protein